MNAAPTDASPPSAPRPGGRGSSGVSGSEKRQRRRMVSVRLSPDEDAALLAKAQAAGLSLGSYLRACALGDAGPRARRGVTMDAELLAAAVAQLNKAGSNLNQIARSLNFGRSVYEAFNIETLAEVRQAVEEIRAAVGRAERSDNESLQSRDRQAA